MREEINFSVSELRRNDRWVIGLGRVVDCFLGADFILAETDFTVVFLEVAAGLRAGMESWFLY